MHVNLLPAKLQQRLLIRRRVAQWTVVWAGCALAAVSFCGLRFRTLRAQHAAHNAKQLECQPVRAIVDDSDALEQTLAAADARYAELCRLMPDDSALAVLGVVSQAAQRTNGSLRIEHVQFLEPEQLGPQATPTAPQPPTTTAAAAVRENGSLSLAGTAKDDLTVALFVDTLRQTRAIRHVELKASSQFATADKEGRRFEIVCGF
jgi:hypothetical protein